MKASIDPEVHMQQLADFQRAIPFLDSVIASHKTLTESEIDLLEELKLKIYDIESEITYALWHRR